MFTRLAAIIVLAQITTTTTIPRCGNGLLESGEQCDPPGVMNPEQCGLRLDSSGRRVAGECKQDCTCP